MKFSRSRPVSSETERAIAEEDTERATVRDGGPPLEAAAPGNHIGRYLLREQLGRGGMGVVWAADDPHLKRRVAVKLLRPDTGTVAQEARLLTEARVMARLSHANVVHVYDASVHEGQLFIAMELVEGTTLARWLRAERRPWQEILRAFMSAGRGLAAAHAAGVIHRDFKASNVLLADDGRVMVTDFGLARAAAIAEPTPPASTGSADQAGQAGRSFQTVTGTLLGTPAYMAPEQFPGGTPDARSDQFAFCVALYEALYRVHPFADALETGAPSMLGHLPVRPPEAAVPRRIFAILTRGMAREPADRHPDLGALLGELDGVMPRSRRPLVLAALGAAGVVGLAAVLFASRDEPDPCSRAAQPAAALWDGAARGKVAAAFRAAGMTGDAFDRVDRAMRVRADGIRAMRRQACVASEVRHQESALLFDRRMQCLDRRGEEIDAFLSVFAGSPGRPVMTRAIEAAVALPPVAACADREALLAAVPPPEDPALRAQVAAVQRTLDRVDTLHEAGKYKEAVILAGQAVAAAGRVDYRPIQARAHYTLARLHNILSDNEEAAREARVALELAAAARDDMITADAWILLYGAVGYDQSRPDEARAFEPAVVAAVERYGNLERRGDLEVARGAIAMGSGDYQVAAEHLLTARRHLAAALGENSPAVANALKNAGMALGSAARWDQARSALEESLAIRTKLYGPEHPLVGQTVRSIGVLLDEMGRPAEALPYFERAAAIYRATLPPDDQTLGNALSSIAVVLDNLDRSPEALPKHLEAIAILEKKPEDNQAPLAYAISNLGISYHAMGRYRDALAAHRRALEIAEKTLGPDHPFVAHTLCNVGEELWRTGEPRLAADDCRRSLAILEKKLGRDHPDCITPLLVLGDLALYRKRPAEALALARRARAIGEKAGTGETAKQGIVLLLEGRALVAGRRAPEGIELIAQGIELMKKAGARRTDLADAEAKLAAAKRR